MSTQSRDVSPLSAERVGKSNRGFASMDPQRQREIARMGGKAAHERGLAHQFTPEEARIAGRKGGEASHGGHRAGARAASTGSDKGRTSTPEARPAENKSDVSDMSDMGSRGGSPAHADRPEDHGR